MRTCYIHIRRVTALLLTAVLLSACSRPVQAPQPASPEPIAQPAPAPSQSGETLPVGPRPETVLPAEGRVYLYYLTDAADTVAESFVRDGERLTGSIGGKPYVTWFITEQGIYRQDPHGPALLRYLPPALADGLTWKQVSGTAEVWFRLARNSCPSNPRETCWDLTTLNRATRSTFRFQEGKGIVYATVENLATPSASFRKTQAGGTPPEPPSRAAILSQMPAQPARPLPTTTPVSINDFVRAEEALLRQYDAILQVDLDRDGKLERIEGKRGVWHSGPLAFFGEDGKRWTSDEAYDVNSQLKLEVGTIAGNDYPALLLHRRRPSGWIEFTPQWLGPKGLYSAWGWHPKITSLYGGEAKLEPDGTLLVSGMPRFMAGYDWVRRFRVKPGDKNPAEYTAELIEEKVTAGPYPTTPDDLITAAFIAHWWDLGADLARYIPNEQIRQSFLATKIAAPTYIPSQVVTGKLKRPLQEVPSITPAPPAVGETAEFLVWVNHYEGGSYYAGRVRFEQAPDGRLVIADMEVTDSKFVY